MDFGITKFVPPAQTLRRHACLQPSLVIASRIGRDYIRLSPMMAGGLPSR